MKFYYRSKTRGSGTWLWRGCPQGSCDHIIKAPPILHATNIKRNNNCVVMAIILIFLTSPLVNIPVCSYQRPKQKWDPKTPNIFFMYSECGILNPMDVITLFTFHWSTQNWLRWAAIYIFAKYTNERNNFQYRIIITFFLVELWRPNPRFQRILFVSLTSGTSEAKELAFPRPEYQADIFSLQYI